MGDLLCSRFSYSVPLDDFIKANRGMFRRGRGGGGAARGTASTRGEWHTLTPLTPSRGL